MGYTRWQNNVTSMKPTKDKDLDVALNMDYIHYAGKKYLVIVDILSIFVSVEIYLINLGHEGTGCLLTSLQQRINNINPSRGCC